MKHALIALLVLVSITMFAQQQTIETSPFTIVERGDHHRLWQSVTTETDAKGNIHYRTHSFTELETGMHFLKDGQWLESREEIEIVAGDAVARHGRHQVIFSANCNSPVGIDMQTADHKRLKSRVLGLAYFDSASGKMVWIAEIKDSTGQLLGANQVIYIDAFTGFKAHLRYTYTKAGFEQDVIIREKPPTPGKFGMNPATTRLQVMTEFLDPPAPVVETRQVDGVTDERLDFGDMAMGSGKAFSLLGDVQNAVPVTKGWGTLDGRVFLVEEASYPLLEPLLRTLPSPQASLNPPKGKLYAVSTRRQLPAVPVARKKSTQPMMVASVPLSGQGVVLDYSTASSTNDYTFKGDVTYYVSGTVNLSGTQTVFEAGCVIKYSPTNTPKLNITSPIKWQGGSYRPVVLTARDDHSVGEGIGTAGLSGYYANPALYIDAAAAGTNAVLQNFRIAYASTAIAINGGSSNVISHAQLVNCARGFAPTNAQFNMRNALFHNVLTNFVGSSSTGRCEHLTVNTANWLNHNSSITLTATNSLLVAVANTGTFTSSYVSNATASAFQTVGAGNHYLTNNTYRNLGTTTINTLLAADLKKKTTFPPVLLSNTVLVNTTLNPQAQRDTDTPDLGYHYDPIDYITWICTVTNATLTVSNGTVIACYNDSGIVLDNGSAFVSTGTPLLPNWFVRYSSAQEQPVALGSAAPSFAVNLNAYHTGTPHPTASLKFSNFACPAGGGYHLYDVSPNWILGNLVVRDCQLWGGQNNLASGDSTTAVVDNNLFYRSSLSAACSANNASLAFSNNLVMGSSSYNTIFNMVSSSHLIKAFDNAFDNCTFGALSVCTNGYNAFINCSANRLNPTNVNDIVLSSLNWQAGPLGDFYQPTNSSLINTGSVSNAGSVGLYHYTVTTNQVKETTTRLDIGFHYVATTNSVPVDTDSDGVPDYLEDTNGNGSVDSGETDWTTYNSPNGLSGGGGLQVFTPLK